MLASAGVQRYAAAATTGEVGAEVVMRKVTIVGGALLFAGACSDDTGAGGTGVVGNDTSLVDVSVDAVADSGGGDTGSSDAASSDTSVVDTTTTDTTATDTTAIDSTTGDVTASDGTIIIDAQTDGSQSDADASDVAITDISIVDADQPPDATMTDVQPPTDVANNDATTSDAEDCYKPTEADMNNGMLGTECKGGFLDAVCNAQDQVIAQCQYDSDLQKNVWEPWNGGFCGCYKTSCGPDQLSCIAIGFVGIARSGAPRKVGRRLRMA